MRSNQLLVIVDFYGANYLLVKEVLDELYIEKKLSAREIAKKISSSKSSVLDALKKFNIPIREVHKPHGKQPQLKYGKKKIQGKIVDHQKEQRVISTIRKLRDEGLTLRKIADVLSEMKIPTKNKGIKWHPQMVDRILKKNSFNDL